MRICRKWYHLPFSKPITDIVRMMVSIKKKGWNDTATVTGYSTEHIKIIYQLQVFHFQKRG